MNIIEALKSGKPFRRKGWAHADYWIVGGGPDTYGGGEIIFLSNKQPVTVLFTNDVIKDDWETGPPVEKENK